MTRTYHLSNIRRFVNRIMMQLTKIDLTPQRYRILTVKGRKSGTLFMTPICLVLLDGKQYMVSPYGEVSWVKNARAAGEVTLRRGGETETLGFTELDPVDTAPILARYYAQEPTTRPYFNVPRPPSLADFAQDAANHPVFLLQTR